MDNKDVLRTRVDRMMNNAENQLTLTNRLDEGRKKKLLYVEGREKRNNYYNLNFLRAVRKTDKDLF